MTMQEFMGMRLVGNPLIPPNVIEFHHADGRIDKFKFERDGLVQIVEGAGDGENPVPKEGK